MTNWAQVAHAWRKHARGAAHGRLAALRASLARDLGLSQVTVLKAYTTLDFVDWLLLQRPEIEADRLMAVPLRSLQALRRLSNLGGHHLDEHLPRMLDGSLRKTELARVERSARSAATAPPTPGHVANAHALRLRSPAFRTAATAAACAAAAAEDATCLAVEAQGPLAPIALDLAILDGCGRWSGVMLRPASAQARKDGDVDNLVRTCLAGARALESYVVLTERRHDAEALARAMKAFHKSGVGVAWLTHEGIIEKILTSDRLRAPDLRDACATRFSTWRESLTQATGRGKEEKS